MNLEYIRIRDLKRERGERESVDPFQNPGYIYCGITKCGDFYDAGHGISHLPNSPACLSNLTDGGLLCCNWLDVSLFSLSASL